MAGVTTRATKGAPLSATEHDGNLETVINLHKAATAPSPTYACMLWADTATSLIKQRNVADDAWVTLGSVDTVFAFVPIKDEDSMASDSATHLATQQSIKAYVDTVMLTEDTLAELNDTNITSAADGSLLLYDTGTSTWRDAALSGDATISDTGVITIADDAIDSDHYAAGSIDNEHLADDAVGIDELSATGTASGSTFLRGDNAWATPTDTDTVYTHPTSAGNKHVPTGGSSGEFLKYDSSGTAVWASDNDTVYTHPTSAGNKHIPSGGSSGQFLKYSSSGTATWASDNDTVYTHPSSDGDLHVPATSTSNDGKLLTAGATAGAISWEDAPVSLPTQTSHSGKYLTTDGSDASWATVSSNSTSYGLYEHAHTIGADYSISSGNNALTAGPITIDTGYSVTVPTGSTWVIV